MRGQFLAIGKVSRMPAQLSHLNDGYLLFVPRRLVRGGWGEHEGFLFVLDLLAHAHNLLAHVPNSHVLSVTWAWVHYNDLGEICCKPLQPQKITKNPTLDQICR